ncbi:MAG: hypothetical protein RL173_338 [Fibrobacterota bacterium]|jgi:hypothetical protein
MKSLSSISAMLLALHSFAVGLPSDALLDSLSVAATEQERNEKLGDRDETESLLERLARQRLVSDSAPEHPKRILDQIDQARSQRAQLEAEELTNLRKPAPEVVKLLEADTLDSIPAAAPPAQRDTIQAKAASKPTLLCSSGPVRIEWIEPPGPVYGQSPQDSTFDFKIRIEAPCGLTRIDLFKDEALLHSFPVPIGKSGTFEFTDQVILTSGIHKLDIVACDSTGICSRSAPLECKSTERVAPWIPRAVGVLVGLCVLLGLILTLRKWTHHPHPSTPQTNHGVPLPASSGISNTIRNRLQIVAKEIGPSFPAVSLRLPDSPPALAIDPESLAEAFGCILRLHAKRTAEGGQILIAMGHGPINAEVVFEDTATTPDDPVIPAILDASKRNIKERLGMDQELENAKQLILRSNGSISMEARIDGGLRTRVRLKLAPHHKDKA